MNRALLIGLGLTLALVGCGREQASGPPTLHPGRDECALCGMIVNEERFSCALLVAKGRSPEYLVFDDIGCMLDYRAAHPDAMVIEGFVHDYGTRQWLDAARGSYVLASPGGLATPMGSGIAAFAGAGAAADHAKAWGASPMDYQAVTAARRAWRELRNAPAQEQFPAAPEATRR